MFWSFIRTKKICKKSLPKLIRIDLVEIGKGDITSD